MTQTIKTPWRVTFPQRDSKLLVHESLLNACNGNEGLSWVLDHFLFTASWTAHNQGLPKEQRVIEIEGCSHKDILKALAGLGRNISERALNNYLHILNANQKTVCCVPYKKTFKVYLDPCQQLIDNPPTGKVRLYEKLGKSARVPNLDQVAALEEKCASMQIELAELRTELGMHAENWARLAEKYAQLAQYSARRAYLPTMVPPDGESVEGHSEEGPLSNITLTLPNITTEERESDVATSVSDITPSLESENAELSLPDEIPQSNPLAAIYALNDTPESVDDTMATAEDAPQANPSEITAEKGPLDVQGNEHPIATETPIEASQQRDEMPAPDPVKLSKPRTRRAKTTKPAEAAPAAPKAVKPTEAQISAVFDVLDLCYQEAWHVADFHAVRSHKAKGEVKALVTAKATPSVLKKVFWDMWNETDKRTGKHYWQDSSHLTVPAICNQYSNRAPKFLPQTATQSTDEPAPELENEIEKRQRETLMREHPELFEVA